MAWFPPEVINEATLANRQEIANQKRNAQNHQRARSLGFHDYGVQQEFEDQLNRIRNTLNTYRTTTGPTQRSAQVQTGAQLNKLYSLFDPAMKTRMFGIRNPQQGMNPNQVMANYPQAQNLMNTFYGSGAQSGVNLFNPGRSVAPTTNQMNTMSFYNYLLNKYRNR